MIKKTVVYVLSIIRSLILYFWNHFFSWIPFSTVRNIIAKLYVNKLGMCSNLLIGVELKDPVNIEIGDNVVVNKGVLLDGRGGLILKNNIDIARGVIIWTMSHDYKNGHESYVKSVIIDDGCWIGANCQILPGVVLGKNVIVGCGSIVTKSFPDNSVVAGNPAKLIRVRTDKVDYKLNYFPWFL